MKLKNTIFLTSLFLLITIKSQAELRNMKCVAKMPTTSLILDTEKLNPELTVIHHNGKGYMPVHFGIVVPNDRTLIQSKIDILSKLPERMIYLFPKEKCNILNGNFVECFSGKPIDIDGTRFTPLSFTITDVIEKGPRFSTLSKRASLLLHVQGFVPVIEVVMDYPADECQFY